MFVGYQNNVACFIGQTEDELKNLPCVVLDKIEEVEFAEMYNGNIYLSEESLILAKQDFVRGVRNSYLEQYVDPVASNPLRWADMTEAEQNEIKDYRTYLLGYTDGENWWEQYPMPFYVWLVNKQKANPEESEQVDEPVEELEKEEEAS